MDVEQMNLEHERLTEEEKAVCEEVKEIIDSYGKEVEEWKAKYKDLEKYADQTSSEFYKLKKQLDDTKSKLKESEEKLNHYKIKFLALKTLVDIAADAQLSHAQRKVLAMAEKNLLTSLVEGKEEVDPIPF